MIRKYNYTGRKKIPVSLTEFNLLNLDGQPYFNANLKIANLGFPNHAKIYVEAYFNTSSLRFDYGTIEDIRQPLKTFIDELPNASEVKFRVKIVDESEDHGKILGKADRIKPLNKLDDGNRESILPVQFDNLQNQVWKVVFDEYGISGPVLVFNHEANVPGISEKIKKNFYFIALIYPIAIRIILDKIKLNEVDEDDWSGKWIHFAESILGVINTPKSEEPASAKEEWIDQVIESFCIKNNLINKINQFGKQ